MREGSTDFFLQVFKFELQRVLGISMIWASFKQNHEPYKHTVMILIQVVIRRHTDVGLSQVNHFDLDKRSSMIGFERSCSGPALVPNVL